MDLVEKQRVLPLIELYSKAYDFKEIVPISAVEAKTAKLLMDVLKKYLPEGEKFYPDDMLTDQTARVLVQELIREKMLELLEEEILMVSAWSDTLHENEERRCYIDNIASLPQDNHRQGRSHAEKDRNPFRGYRKVVGHEDRGSSSKGQDDWRNNDYMLRELGYKHKGTCHGAHQDKGLIIRR